MPKDPALENIDAIAQKPFQAYPGQDHRAHISAHLYFMSTNMVRNNPIIMGAMEKNILEHISIMAQEQIQVEFKQQMAMLPQLQQQAPTNPQAQQQLQQITQQLEARKAVLIAEMMEEFMKEEKRITSQFDHDPLLKIKSREVDLKAIDTQRKDMEMKQRGEIDRAKLVQSRDIHEDKIEQNEELSELRADTSLQKQQMANEARERLAKMKPKR